MSPDTQSDHDELRELIREAHAATRDLRQAVKDARQERALYAATAKAELAASANELISRGIIDFLKSNAGRNMINVHVRQLVIAESKAQLQRFNDECDEIFKEESAALRNTLESINVANANANKSLDQFARDAARTRDLAIRETRLAITRMMRGLAESPAEPAEPGPGPADHEPGARPGRAA